ncbi:HdeD family acid-resistance protein [Monashia sp. NPDC004114]
MIVTSPVDELRTWTRGQIEAVSKGWWVLLATGVISIVAGVIIVFTQWTVDNLVIFVGTVLIVRGIFTIFSIPVDGSLRMWSIVLGIVEAAVGVGVFIWPGPALLVVAFSIGWLLFFRGTMAIVGSITSRKVLPYWGVVLVAGILEVFVAYYLLTRPDITLLAAVFAVGFSAMLYGVLEITVAFVVRSLPKRFEELTGTVGQGGTSAPLGPVS